MFTLAEERAFSRANNAMRIAQEEIFGPVLTMIPYITEEEAIAIANDTVYGLSGFVWSGTIEHARAVAQRRVISDNNSIISGRGHAPSQPRPLPAVAWP